MGFLHGVDGIADVKPGRKWWRFPVEIQMKLAAIGQVGLTMSMNHPDQATDAVAYEACGQFLIG
jgi:hypothetical protein